MLYKQAAGCIIYTVDKQCIYYLLLRYQAGHWDFAKGHSEIGETLQQTAQREIFEETGLTLSIDDNFECKYSYELLETQQQKIYKTVWLFIAKSSTKDISLSDEHSDYTWLMFDQALKLLTHINAQQSLIKAHSWITHHSLLAID